MPEDLFGDAADRHRTASAPLAARLRPRSLDEVVGQEHLLGPGRPLRKLIESDRLSSLVLWGPPGTGKTTLARLIAGATRRDFVALSAVSAGVKDVRSAVEGARRRWGEQASGTILFLDFTAHSLGVRLVRSCAPGAVWDTPLRGRCTPHSRREHRDVDAGGRPAGAAREPSRRPALLRRARYDDRGCPRPR